MKTFLGIFTPINYDSVSGLSRDGLMHRSFICRLRCLPDTSSGFLVSVTNRVYRIHKRNNFVFLIGSTFHWSFTFDPWSKSNQRAKSRSAAGGWVVFVGFASAVAIDLGD